MKPSILVPVDFTDNAFNAYLYANNLAYYLDCDLHLLHITDTNISEAREERKSLEDRLRSFSSWRPNEVSKKFYPVGTRVEVAAGKVVDEILSASNREVFRFIVCASRDQHTIRDRWFGTISSEIALNAPIPVILVPKSAEFRDINSIVVGCDEHAKDENVLSHLAVISDWFESKVYFAHVKESSDHKFVAVEKDILDMLLALKKKSFNVEMIYLEGIDVVNALFSFTTRIKADLMVMVSEKRNFLQRLLFQSVSRKAALETSVPTMIMNI